MYLGRFILILIVSFGLSFCGGGGADGNGSQMPETGNKFAEKIDFFPSIEELESNDQSIISFTFSAQSGETIFIDINNMAQCSSNDSSCVILVNNGENDLTASGNFMMWTGGLAFIQCEAMDNPVCQINLESSGNYAIGLSS